MRLPSRAWPKETLNCPTTWSTMRIRAFVQEQILALLKFELSPSLEGDRVFSRRKSPILKRIVGSPELPKSVIFERATLSLGVNRVILSGLMAPTGCYC